MQIVTGRRGEPHVTSRQMQAVYRSFLGDFALFDVGAHLAATATSNDNVRISDGVVAVQGIYAVIAYNEYDDNYIEPVSVGMKRIDTLILHYTKSNDIEDMQIEVVEGEEAVDNPVAPTIAEGGDAWEGTADIKVPIYDVLVTSFGLTVTPYSRMNTLIPTLDSIAERIPESIVTGVKGDSETLYRNGNVNITKDNIGLGNVDNTADTDKPVSNATQTALNLKADLTYVDAKIAAAYHAGGSKTVAELTSALLIADNMGKVYNMSDSGTTTSDFVEGAGEPINEGDNVGICNVGTEENPVYKFDLLSGFVDLSAYVTTSALNTRLAEKVDKVPGKGLSTNDYTNEEKQKNADNASAIEDIQEDISTSQTATGNPITIESSESNLVECIVTISSSTNTVTITVKDKSTNPTVTNTYTIDLGRTVSSGTLDVVKGTLTTGGTTYNLPPTQIKLLKGNNVISSNVSSLSIKYYPDNVLGQLKGDIESEYDERVETLETQVQELQPSLIFMSRERRDITSDLSRLSIAVAEQNLEKYGYKIGDYFERVDGNRTYTYHIADPNTYKGTVTPYCLTENHYTIVVDTHSTSQWYSGDASAVGYNGSTLHTYLKGTVLDNIKADMIYFFGGTTGLEHLLSHSKLLTTALANWGWQANQYISALTCTQIDAGSQWTANGFQEGEASKSLELFRKHKWTEIFESRYPWLRNLSNYSGGSVACCAHHYGYLRGDHSVAFAYYVVGLIIFH